MAVICQAILYKGTPICKFHLPDQNGKGDIETGRIILPKKVNVSSGDRHQSNTNSDIVEYGDIGKTHF